MRQLSEEAILQIYKEHNWFIFDPDLSRAKAVARKAEQEIMRQVVELLPQIPISFYHNRTCFDCVERIKESIGQELKKQALEGQAEEGK